MLRPLWHEFPENKEVFGIDEEFMAGPSVLVRPVFQAGAASVDTTLPKGARWYCAHTGAEEAKVTGKAQKVAVSPGVI